MIIVVGGTKGGCGKTTIATNLAVLRSQDGNKVLLIDADKQQSSSKFASARDISKIPSDWTTIILEGTTLHSQITRLIVDYDDIIIDTGGYDSVSQRSALAVADMYLIPFRPRGYDIWEIGRVTSVINDISPFNPRLKSFGFINQADTSIAGNENEQAKEQLKQCPDLICLDHVVGMRKAFGNSSVIGLAVHELKKNRDQKAIDEMRNLYEAVFQYGI